MPTDPLQHSLETDGGPLDQGGPALRIVLVGRSPIERTLRRDRRFELIRARTALEAVGELGDPIDEGSPADAAVLIATGGEPDPEGSDASTELQRFIEALRLLHEPVRVVRIGGGEADGYDAQLADDATADDVFDACSGAGQPVEPEATELEVEPATEPEPLAAIDADPLGDAELASALIRGRDFEPIVLERLRAVSGLDDLDLVDADADLPDVPSGEQVEWNGRVYGVLRSKAGSPQQVRSAASWLATWLRLAEQHAELSEAAFTDSLTGAWNRRYFDRFLPAAITRTRHRRGDLTLLYFDLDNFKTLNDRFGHAAGDAMLTETVRLMRSVVRPTDKVCRIGGDEFAVIFYEPDGPRESSSRHPEDVGGVLERFRAAIRAHRFPALGDEAPGPITISAGLATFPWDGHDAASLVRRADELAMESKQTGKNRVTFGKRDEH